ncbi:20003_t:CDS:1, partial [Gigaspora rosea]
DFGPSTNASADIYLMNLSNYTWVTQFENIPSPPAPPAPNSTYNTKLITIIIPVVGLAIIITGICIAIRVWRRCNPNPVNERLVEEPPS